jgi:hypothetical protein
MMKNCEKCGKPAAFVCPGCGKCMACHGAGDREFDLGTISALFTLAVGHKPFLEVLADVAHAKKELGQQLVDEILEIIEYVIGKLGDEDEENSDNVCDEDIAKAAQEFLDSLKEKGDGGG